MLITKRNNTNHDPFIRFPELIPGVLIKRYKRFLADIKLDSGEMVTAHCPNSGRMTTCADPGRPVYVSYHDDPKRKLKYTWELIEMPDSLMGVNTNIPNRLVANAITHNLIPELKGYDSVKPEIRTGDHTRLDLLLTKSQNSEINGPDKCFIEIKNSTLIENRTALFPDAVTTRGQKHLVELQKLAKEGHRAVIFFLIQRTDADKFSPADHVDPEYGSKLRIAHKNGVEVLVYDVKLDLEKVIINKKIPYYF